MKIKLMLIAAIITTNACASASSFKIDKETFDLVDNSNFCQVISVSQEIKLNLLIPWPCQVHKDSSGKVRIFKKSEKKYILVESAVPHPELPNDCITQLQAVMIYEGGIKQSEHKDTVASCPPFQWDTKVFTELFSGN